MDSQTFREPFEQEDFATTKIVEGLFHSESFAMAS